MNYKYKYHALRRDCFDFSLLAHRNFGTMLIAMHQSETHLLDILKNISVFLELEFSKEQFQHGIHSASKSKTQIKYDPTSLATVRDEKRNPVD